MRESEQVFRRLIGMDADGSYKDVLMRSSENLFRFWLANL